MSDVNNERIVTSVSNPRLSKEGRVEQLHWEGGRRTEGKDREQHVLTPAHLLMLFFFFFCYVK